MDPIFRIDSSGLVWEHWCRHAAETPDHEAIIHLSVEREPYRWRWGELIEAARRAARWLSTNGVRQGDVCALIIRHNPWFYPLYMGVSWVGALPAVLAYPNARLHPDKFRQGLEGMSKHSGLDHIVTERDLSDDVAPLVAGDASTIRSILCPPEWLEDGVNRGATARNHPFATSDDPCLLQHSSGTTGLQKGVVLSHRAVLEHVRRYGEVIALSKNDKIVSWLPLYHDMGLIAAFYLPLICGVPLVQLSPMEWVSSPILLLDAISRESATLCWLPNFAYNFMADRIRDEDLQGARLDSMRMFINCSEPVREESHRKFKRKFEPFGLRDGALGACYAMAETTFAVTQTPPGRAARVLTVDREALSQGKVLPIEGAKAAARACVSSGFPLPGCAVRIVDEERRDLESGRVGEIAISSISLFAGYRNYPEKTAKAMQDGWYFSGDYGFIDDGECFVVGRKKDVIIVAGNNMFPEDIEDAVGQVGGVIPGRVVAFGVEDDRVGTEVICVIAETTAKSEEDTKAVRRAIILACMAIDITISRVYLVPPRWMIKSSSGKPARSANRARALAELSWK